MTVRKNGAGLDGAGPVSSFPGGQVMTCPPAAYPVSVMKMKKALPVAVILMVAALLLLRPQEAAAAVRDGLTLCARTVLPSLFPFFVVISLLLQLGLAEALQGVCGAVMGPLFRLRGVCALPLLAGLLGGYPSGAGAAAGLYEQGSVSRQEAELLLGFCDNCGPAFLMGYIGAGVLGNAGAGVLLFLIHILSAVLAGVVLCRLCRERGSVPAQSRRQVRAASFPQALTASVSGAVQSMMNICAFVVLFRVLAALPPVSLPFPVLGALEMVSAAAALPAGWAALPAAAAIVGWGGLSVHCQAMSIAAPAGLSFRWHWLGKALQAALSFLLAAAVQRFLPL